MNRQSFPCPIAPRHPAAAAAVTALAAGLTFTPPARAHEEPFAWTRGAQVEARGEWEIEQWITTRLGKKSGDYVGLDLSTEIEYGVTDHLQTALYLNNRYHHLRGVEGGHETFDDREAFNFDGVSGEVKWQLSDAFREPWGLALYFEPGFARFGGVSGEREDKVFLEFKGIVERHFLDHRLIAAFNYTCEPEWERESGEDWETALEMAWNLGLSWQLAPGWRVGLEARLDTEFEDADLGHAEFSSFSLGPTIHHSGGSWFATLSVLPQLTGWPDAPGTAGRHLDDREQVEIRAKIGVEF